MRRMRPRPVGRDRSLQPFSDEVVQALPSLRAYALRLTRNPDAADELVQETMLRAFRFQHRYRLGTNCVGWLRAILRNILANRYRSAQWRAEWLGLDHVPDAAMAQGLEDRVLGSIAAEGVWTQVRSVPEPFRSAVVMADVSDLSYDQIAALLCVPVGTVKSRVCRGRRFLRKRLREYAER